MSSNPTTTSHPTVDELASKAELGVVVEVEPHSALRASPALSLTMCAWCERVSLAQAWVEKEVTIRELRTFELPDPPSFTHRICPACLGDLTRRREEQAS